MKFIVFFIFSSCQLAFAFKFSPMNLSIDVDKNLQEMVFVENDSDQAMAIELSITDRKMNELGVENNSVVDSLFEIFPEQIVVPPKEKRGVKIKYVGDKKIEGEKSYRLIAEQLPLEFDKNKNSKGNVKILLKYIAALYVSKDSFKSNLNAKIIEDSKNDLTIEVENIGSAHQVLSQLDVIFTKNKEKLNINILNLKELNGENILSKSKRIFKVLKKEELVNLDKNFNVQFKFEKN